MNVLLQCDASSYLPRYWSFHKCQRSLGEPVCIKSASINLRLTIKKVAVLTAEGSFFLHHPVESRYLEILYLKRNVAPMVLDVGR